MMKTKELVDEISSLPIEERASIVDSILKTLNTMDSEIDKKWLEVGNKRLEELKSGSVKGVSGDKVFKKINKRFSE